ncbi:MAG TPA: hypothetical protein VMC81_00210 [Rhodocyclaceae bacterium]|nr:hypothetical protein [Rhodocyclaceae bacterium]
MSMRPSSFVLLALGGLVLVFLGCLIDAQTPRAEEICATQALARRLGLTDLALFTEARYARHPSQADLHSAFQDHPLALEHFPSGSLIVPNRELLDRTTTTPD